MIKLLRYLEKREYLYIIACLGAIILQVWFDLKLPDYMSEITTLVQLESDIQRIVIAGMKMLLCGMGSFVSAALTAWFAARISSDLSANVRLKLFEKVQSFSLTEINGFTVPSLITRSTNDIAQIQAFTVMGLQMLFKAPIMAVWAIVKILDKSWQWSAVTGIAVIFIIIAVGVLILLTIPRFQFIQELTDDLNRVARENLTGLEVIRSYNAENSQEEKFDDINRKLTRHSLFANRIMGMQLPVITMTMNFLALTVYVIGAMMIQSAASTDKLPLFSDMVAFSAYAAQLLLAFVLLITIFLLLPVTQVSAKRINAVIEKELSLQNGTEKEVPIDKKGEVEFINVDFCYPGTEKNALENISFKAEKGETVAIIGATGAGKTTLVNLIPRFFDVTGGKILVDGMDVKKYDANSLTEKIGYVLQKAMIFEGTLRSNISFGKEGADVEKAAGIAQLTDFIETLEDKADSYVAQSGGNLSGGQKQRVAIARAVARKPEILIFDDSFSALDYKTDRKLRAMLETEMADTTKIIVAQRISTIRKADRIIALENGRIAGCGTHDELMKSCEVYQEIAHSQLSQEELAYA